MSYYGRQCLLEIVRRESEIAWWSRYSDRLTSAECKRLREGNYAALKRPIAPAFRKGQRLEPARGLTVIVECIEPGRRDNYLVKFGRVEDFRNRSAVNRPLRSDPALVTTLCLVEPNAPQTEPGRVDKEVEDRIAERASEREVMRLRQYWTMKRAQIAEAIADLRAVGLDDRELWIMERRMAKLDEKLGRKSAA